MYNEQLKRWFALFFPNTIRKLQIKAFIIRNDQCQQGLAQSPGIKLECFAMIRMACPRYVQVCWLHFYLAFSRASSLGLLSIVLECVCYVNIPPQVQARTFLVSQEKPTCWRCLSLGFSCPTLLEIICARDNDSITLYCRCCDHIQVIGGIRLLGTK